MQKRRPVMLVILDGWGWREETEDNAVRQAETPTFDRLWATGPHAFLRTSGEDVGLPDGQMGNSEVGHLNIGAGRVVMQDLPRITNAIVKGDIERAPALVELIKRLKASGGTCHLIGLMSPGGVHSHQDHAVALARILTRAGVPTVVHAFTDGRDTPPTSADDYLKSFIAALPPQVPIATVSGRYYAMDRDNRWERVAKAYNVIVDAEGAIFPDARAVIWDAYQNNTSDEFVMPGVVGNYRGMQDGDGILCFNFRADRVRELLGVILNPPAFSSFGRRTVQFAAAVGMTQYSEELDGFMQTIFPPQTLPNILGDVVAAAGRTQLRMAETEKYPHVTYFLNGGEEDQYPGEDRIMVPSPKVATYDLQPEMSAPELTDKAVDRDQVRQVRPDRPELRQPRHGRPHRQPAGRDQGGRDGRHRPRPHCRCDRQVRRRAAGHRRPRQLRDDARSENRRAAHRAHHQSGAGAADGRRRGVAGERPAGRHRADAARIDGAAEAARDDRRFTAAQEKLAALTASPAVRHIAKPEHVGHRIKPRLLPARPGRGGQRAAREDHAVLRAVHQLDPLGGPREDHAVLADHGAAAQRRKTDVAHGARAGVAVAAADRALRSRSMPRPSAAALPSSSAVPDGASIFLL